MEKRNNKKLFAIIGGSVLAFVLTIALSVSITLAYFGDTKNDDTKITLGQAVTLNAVTIAQSDPVTLVPTQKANLTTTITGAATTTESYLFIEVITDVAKGSGTATETELEAIETALNEAITDAVGTTWFKLCDTTDGTLYALGTGSTLAPLGDGEVSKTFDAAFNIPGAELTNTAALAEISFTVKAVRLQKAYGTDGTTEMTNDQYQAIVLGAGFLNTSAK